MSDFIEEISAKLQQSKSKKQAFLIQIKELINQNVPPSEQGELQRKSRGEQQTCSSILSDRINDIQILIGNGDSINKLVSSNIRRYIDQQQSIFNKSYEQQCDRLTRENLLLRQELIGYQIREKSLRQQLVDAQKEILNMKITIQNIKRLNAAKNTKIIAKINLLRVKVSQFRKEIRAWNVLLQNIDISSKKLKKDLQNNAQTITSVSNKDLKDQTRRLAQRLQELQNGSIRFQQLLQDVSGLKHPSRGQPESVFQQYRIQLWNYFKYSVLLKGSQIVKQNFHRKWILNKLQRLLQFKKIDSKLLFRYDKLNSANFHNYIDSKYNWLLLVELSNGTIIGGYSYFPLQEDRVDRPGRGFIFNLNQLQDFYPKNYSHLQIVTYDSFSIIFGNSEIRVSQKQLKVFSNFGIRNGFFENNNCKLEDFLGQDCKELPIVTYEVFELIVN